MHPRASPKPIRTVQKCCHLVAPASHSKTPCGNSSKPSTFISLLTICHLDNIPLFQGEDNSFLGIICGLGSFLSEKSTTRIHWLIRKLLEFSSRTEYFIQGTAEKVPYVGCSPGSSQRAGCRGQTHMCFLCPPELLDLTVAS